MYLPEGQIDLVLSGGVVAALILIDTAYSKHAVPTPAHAYSCA